MGAMINEDRFGVVAATIDVASVAANTTAEQTFAVQGLKVGDFVAVSKPSLTAGLGVSTARVSAANTLAITFDNNTAGAIDPAPEAYLVFWFRPEKTPTAVNP
jgi:hypothetical protein